MSLPYNNSLRCKTCTHYNQNHYNIVRDARFGRLDFIWEGVRPCVITNCECVEFLPENNLDYLEYKFDKKTDKNVPSV